MKLQTFIVVLAVAASVAIGGAVRTSQAAEVDCLMCHPDLSSGKSVHAAVNMGCAICHSGVDAGDIPHKFSAPKGLSAEQPDLCYGCHDKKKFYGPTIHAPVGIGSCTGCHNPHRSDNAKLLIAAGGEVCFNCHDKAAFSKKVTHEPVKSGNCVGCHKPHVSQNESLLLRKGNSLCTRCHLKVRREPHAVAGFNRAGHPLRGRKDPNRPGKTFECLSCHMPHASDSVLLFRYKADTMFDICVHCHEM